MLLILQRHRSILELLKDINRRLGLTILLITHEMDVVKRICDQVAVISGGQLVESDAVSEVSLTLKHPFLKHLFNQHYNWIFLTIIKNV